MMKTCSKFMTLDPSISKFVVLIKFYSLNIIVVKMIFTKFQAWFKRKLVLSCGHLYINQSKNYTKNRMKYWTLQRCCKDIFCYGGLIICHHNHHWLPLLKFRHNKLIFSSVHFISELFFRFFLLKVRSS